MRPGPNNALTDVAGLWVGCAETDATGVSVVTAAEPFTAAVHVMGGAPGTRETDLLAPDRLVQQVDALVLSGGSAFGLAAADGVAQALAEAGRGFAVGPHRVPIVPAAILFDLSSAPRPDYATLGRVAFAAAGAEVPLGSAGAGVGARAGQMRGGQGTASLVLPGGATVAALVAANPVGNVGHGGRFHAWPFEIDGEFGGLGPPPADLAASFATGRDRPATTIAVVATDAPLTQAEATRMAVAAHDGIARAVQPAHTPHDGDLVFAAAPGGGPAAPLRDLGHAAAVCLARAIARGVWHAAPGGGAPAWRGP